jgi:Zn-dependent alcohol dehydrogenase
MRLYSQGLPIHHYSHLSTFARHAVVSEHSCIGIPADVPFEVAALVGCAVMTGFGAVVNRARVVPGSSVAVFGAGGVGLSAVMAARLAGAGIVIAVDILESKRALAVELGATLALDGTDPGLVGLLLDASGGGLDYAFEAVGSTKLAELAFAATRPGGMVVAVGVPPEGAKIELPASELVRSEKVVTGTFYGSSRPLHDVPMILGLYREGRLPLDKLVTRRYRLEDVNLALADMTSGRVARGVIRPWEGA